MLSRRSFFSRLFGAAAALAVAPKVLAAKPVALAAKPAGWTIAEIDEFSARYLKPALQQMGDDFDRHMAEYAYRGVTYRDQLSGARLMRVTDGA